MSRPKSLPVINAQKWLSLDIQHFSSGALPVGANDAETAVHKALFVDSKVRTAAAHALSHEPLDPLQKIRAFLARGETQMADEIIAEISAEPRDDLTQVELGLEQARLLGLLGDWLECIQVSTYHLQKNPSSITRLSLLMVRAVAFFETGDIVSCQKDLRFVDSLVALYPFSVSCVFAKIQDAKVDSIQGHHQLARQKIDAVWNNLSNRSLWTPEYLLSLLRADLFLAQNRGPSKLNLAIACWQLAHHVGNDIYRDLALLDILASLPAPQRQLFYQDLVLPQTRVHPRIQKLAQELIDQQPTSTSGRILCQTSANTVADNSPSVGDGTLGVTWQNPIDLLIYPDREISFVLTDFAVNKLPRGKVSRAFVELARGPMTKEEFFEKIWLLPKFHQHLHQSPLHMLISRLRKFGAEVTVEDGVIQLQKALVL